MPKKSKKRIIQEVRERLIGYITAALGLITGLAWNEVIKELISALHLPQGENLIARFVYALLMTVLVAIAAVYLAQLMGAHDEE